MCDQRDSDRQAGTGEIYKGRGVWVPHGLKASWIMEGAWALESEFDVAPFVSRMMAEAVIRAVEGIKQKEISETHQGARVGSTSFEANK
jgi:hypothetical protein